MHRSMNFVPIPMFVGATNPNFAHRQMIIIIVQLDEDPSRIFLKWPIFPIFKMATNSIISSENVGS